MSTNPRIPYQLSSARAPLAPPPGGGLIVHVVVNIENWRFDHPMPRKLLTAPHGAEAVPDVPNFAWAEYGMRCGMPRLFETFARRGLPVTCAFNASVIDTYPDLAVAVRDAGWEFMGHAYEQGPMHLVDDQKAMIDKSIAVIEKFTGAKPVGWLGPGLTQTYETPELLAAAGIKYIGDWVYDDEPTAIRTAKGPLVTLPYTVELR